MSWIFSLFRWSTPGTIGCTPYGCQGHGLFVTGGAAVMRAGHAPGTRLLLPSRVTPQGVEVESGRGLDIRLEYALHVEQRVPVLLRVLGCHTIGLDHQVQVAHVRVVGGEEHTDVPGQPGEDDGGYLWLPVDKAGGGPG
jgi:hypothetical protein